MYLAGEERAGADDDLRAAHDLARVEPHAAHGAPGVRAGRVLEDEVVHARGADVEVRVVVQRVLHVPLVQLAVYLCAWALQKVVRGFRRRFVGR